MKITSSYNPSDWIKKDNSKVAEPQTPPIVESESLEKKVQEIPRVKRTGQESKKGNKRPVIENNRKSAFEILMEED